MRISQIFAPTFGIIAAASIVSNALFCFLMYKKPGLLKKPHNILLLSLATIDMMTGNIVFCNQTNLESGYIKLYVYSQNLTVSETNSTSHIITYEEIESY